MRLYVNIYIFAKLLSFINFMKITLYTLAFLGSILFLNSCEYSENLAVISTKFSINDITTTTALSGGVIIDDKGFTVTARGVCWSENPDPTTKDSMTTDGTGVGLFTSSVQNLKPNTSYYLRAYATSKSGTSYGNTISFKTLSGIAGITTGSPDSIKATSVVINGEISLDGGAEISQRGFCLALNTNPSISDIKVVNGAGLGAFANKISGLSPGNTYYLRSFATNSAGTTYGNEVQFTTQSGIMQISTNPASNILAFSTTLGGTILYDGGEDITSQGVCWSTTPNPTINTNKSSVEPGIGNFSLSVTDLEHETTYYVRAYAINKLGITYGNEISFTTKDGIISISTQPITNVGVIDATSGGVITGDGGAGITTRGVCWSTNPGPTISLSTKTSNGIGTGSFSSSIKGLSEGTTYYVRAYATNNIGTIYGNEISFTTNQLTADQIMDVDGNVYNTIQIGNQIWMVENLKTTRYRNGVLIGTTNPSNKDISSENNPKYQWAYGGNENYVDTYGRLYTWHTITDSRNVAPLGWRIPTDADWTILENYLIANGYNYDGSLNGNKIAKSISAKNLWETNANTGSIGNNLSKNNSTGFYALPAGYRFNDGTFGSIGSYCSWWSSSESNTSSAWSRSLNSNYINLNRASSTKNYGFSVRCIKEN
jgi:uncharacterized protein (TIGR02145 family)